MNLRGAIAICIVGIVHGALAQQAVVSTPNDLLKAGAPTFIVGTAGDDREDRAIEAQVTMMRDLLFPGMPIVPDRTVVTARGAEAWPRNPIVYGGPHVNSVVSELASFLPFKIERGKLTIGDKVFEGDEYRLIALIPKHETQTKLPGYPDFLLYAGTGSPGIAEINAIRHGADPILIVDRFGRLLSGRWVKKNNGEVAAEFTGPPARRIPWRSVSREYQLAAGAKHSLEICFPKDLSPAANEEEIVAACLRGVQTSIRKLEIAQPAAVTIHVYPDARSKVSLTGREGDGEADVISRSLHTVAFDAKPDGAMENLLAHEASHVLAYEAWGAAGTPLLGEGIAVWVSGKYGGVSLKDWRTRLAGQTPSVKELLGSAFRKMPEQQSYPLSGLLAEAAIAKVGLHKFRDHLIGATQSTWDAACKNAGTSPQEIESAWHKLLSKASP